MGMTKPTAAHAKGGASVTRVLDLQVIQVTNRTSVTSSLDRLVLQVSGYGIPLGRIDNGADSNHLKSHTQATPAGIEGYKCCTNTPKGE